MDDSELVSSGAGEHVGPAGSWERRRPIARVKRCGDEVCVLRMRSEHAILRSIDMDMVCVCGAASGVLSAPT